MSEDAWALVVLGTAAAALTLVALVPKPEPIRADPPPVAWCVQTEPQVVFPESDTYDLPPTEQMRHGGMFTFYPCKMLKKEQDV